MEWGTLGPTQQQDLHLGGRETLQPTFTLVGPVRLSFFILEKTSPHPPSLLSRRQLSTRTTPSQDALLCIPSFCTCFPFGPRSKCDRDGRMGPRRARKLTRVLRTEPPGCRRCLPTCWPQYRCGPDEDFFEPYRLAKRYVLSFFLFLFAFSIDDTSPLHA